LFGKSKRIAQRRHGKRNAQAMQYFARAKVAKMSDGKELIRDVMAMICEAKNWNSMVSLGIALAAIRNVSQRRSDAVPGLAIEKL